MITQVTTNKDTITIIQLNYGNMSPTKIKEYSAEIRDLMKEVFDNRILILPSTVDITLVN